MVAAASVRRWPDPGGVRWRWRQPALVRRRPGPDGGIWRRQPSTTATTVGWQWKELGALVTAGVLTAGLISFRYGNSQLGQKLMRARVVAQGATVALMIGSAYYYGDQIKLFKKGSSP